MDFFHAANTMRKTHLTNYLDFICTPARSQAKIGKFALRKVRGQGGRPKMLGGVVFSTLRTFLADNAGIGLCSRPQ